MKKRGAARSGRDAFRKHKGIINIVTAFYRLFPKKARINLFVRHRKTKGKFGMLVRYALLKTIAASCGDNVKIDTGVYLLNPENARFGNNVSINPMCYIEALGGLEIGDNVSIAHGVTIMTTSHSYSDLETPIKYQKLETKPVLIKDNVWLGAKATVLYGRILGAGSIIGAAAVVTKDVAENSIVAGIPACEIKKRI